MRPVFAVVDPPFFDDTACSSHAAEQALVETFVAKAAVQALHEAVLGGLTGRDVVPLDAIVLLSLQDRTRRQFDTVVGNDHQRPAAQLDHEVQFPRHPHSRQ